MGFTLTSPDIWKTDFRDAFEAIDIRTHVDLASMKARYTDAKAGDKFITCSGLFVFEELRRIMGDVTMLESLLLEPEWVHDFCRAITAKNIAYFEYIFREVGLPDGLHIYEDLGYTAAPFASPTCHREMIMPYHKELFGYMLELYRDNCRY